MLVAEIQIGGTSFKKIRFCFVLETHYLCYENRSIITKFRRKVRISANSAKNTHVFRKGVLFLRILRKRRTFPMGRICRFPQEFTKCYKKYQKTANCDESEQIH